MLFKKAQGKAFKSREIAHLLLRKARENLVLSQGKSTNVDPDSGAT
jgi:hypothetical protein